MGVWVCATVNTSKYRYASYARLPVGVAVIGGGGGGCNDSVRRGGGCRSQCACIHLCIHIYITTYTYVCAYGVSVHVCFCTYMRVFL